MYDIDPTQAFLLIEARSQLAGAAFGLSENAGVLIQPKQTQPVNVAPSGTASEIALQLRLDKKPIDPKAGHIFGSSKNDWDVLLDTESNRGVSSKAFSIEHHRKTQDLILNCLARKGIFFREDTEDLQLRRLLPGSPLYLQPGHTWIIVLGSIQIALSAILRDDSEQKAYDRNLKDYVKSLDKAVLDVGKLNLHASATSTEETPDTKVLTGIRGNYTAAWKVGEGGMGSITACVSKTGVSCCIKNAKPGLTRESIEQEVRCLRRVAHPSIVKYIDRDENFTWVAMELLGMGNLQQQQRIQSFTMREIKVLIYQLLDALSHIHSCDILHHDIKDVNILVQIRTEEQILVKVADFGISCQGSNHPNKNTGHPYYLAPECFERSPKFWGVEIDVWGLAMVALQLLFKLPIPPKQPEDLDYTSKSPFAKGWGGALKDHFAKNVKEYLKKNPKATDHFFRTLSRMFQPDPKARIRALEACQNLRKEHKPGFFLSLGTEDRTPRITQPTLPTDTRSDDDSIFRFRELEVKGISTPILMLEGCYLVIHSGGPC